MVRTLMIFLAGFLLNSSEAASQQHFRTLPDTAHKKISLKPLPQNFYKESLGFFCKKELQIQKAVKLPVYFRLGTKQYTDYLERKPNSHFKSF
jgi:hypothetical protein